MKLKNYKTNSSEWVKQYRKKRYKKIIQKTFLFLSIVFFAIGSSQSNLNEKQKILFPKDTIKNNKSVFDKKEVFSDSLLVVKGQFKFYKKSAHASYYADKFHGRRTASGKKYDKNKYTAAHKRLPFGTKVRITNEVNGKSVIVEITDRGPFVRAREIDLSKRAFMDIANNKGSGAMMVTIDVLQE